MVAGATDDDVEAQAVTLANELESGKISRWRTACAADLLDKFAKNTNSAERRTLLAAALRVRDEGVTNTYRELGIRRRYQRWLIGALLAIGAALLIVLSTHAGDDGSHEKRHGRDRDHVASACDGVARKSSTTVSTSPPEPAISLTADERACQLETMKHGWVVWVSALAGSVGAVASALQRVSRPKLKQRVPEVLASYLATVSRVLLGAIAGITFYLAYRSGVVVFPSLEVRAVAVLGAFSFGFTERFFTIGEKPIDTDSMAPPAPKSVQPSPS